jgi:hypothetical protein
MYKIEPFEEPHLGSFSGEVHDLTLERSEVGGFT